MIGDQFNIITNYYFLQLSTFIMNLFQKLKAFYAPFRIKAQFFHQSKLFKKRYLAFLFFTANVPICLYYCSQYPQETTLYISRHMEKVSELELPEFTRNLIFGAYSKLYGVNEQEMVKKFQQYKCFSQFFTRKIKPRQIAKQQSAIVSPSDSKILAFGEITEDSVFAVKGYSYSLGHLICGEEVAFTKQDIDLMKRKKQNKLYHCILYLAPGDYHRFHAASNFSVTRRKAISGALFSVDQKSIVKRDKVYQTNSRLILHGKWKQGYLAMIFVGALNVGRIVVKDKLQFTVGQEMGLFNLGSTIVLIFQSPEMDWKIVQQQNIRYGEVLGQSLEVPIK